ncbi:alpha/beta fold hydrolase [Polaribacter ponticola]|uniref:Alpha/beta hydrolase n=1 Tax=Polaribacter ponticola TaxID=2978475 RepID=A0ABT5S6K3_9FLAO|nr:alpha/beta hydrolase [Polaribacter sp. MSW5]MDD7913733.1 alpha/beta hydrolase [Polaribacter sp. MSW5]
MNLLLDNNGDKLYTTIYPNKGKETVILLHGGPGVPDNLLAVAKLLTKRFQVISFHQRGTKLSPNKSNNYSIDKYLSDIETIKNHFSLSKIHLLGHSWGGLYAQIYSEKYPKNLLSLVLCSSGSGTNIEWKQTEKEAMQFNKSKSSFGQWSKMGWNSFVGAMGNDKAYQNLFKQVIKNYNVDFNSSNKEISGFSLENVKAKPINKTRKEIIKYPLLQKQIHIKYPILIMYGENDIYRKSKKFVTNRFPTAKVKYINKSGHLPWLHNPNEFKTILNSFYNSIKIE